VQMLCKCRADAASQGERLQQLPREQHFSKRQAS
jgi:hypothetical protein